jgi:hypothetical protein
VSAELSPAEVVERQLAAYNAHDLERFIAEYAEDVQLFRPPAVEPMLSGKRALAAHYAAHRFNVAALHARVLSRIVCGNKVADHEVVEGLPGGTVEALVIFEVVDARIQNVWFF